MDDADLRQLEREVGARSELLLAHALARYIHDAHPFELAMRSPNAIPWLEHGQYLLAVRLDDLSEFWRIRDQLAAERQTRN